jgi:RNA polymerase sigma-70 factor (ECF subfamily)
MDMESAIVETARWPARTEDRARFVALDEAHAGAVLAYARRRVGESDADDVLAETFLVVWRRRAQVPDDALPWLYAVAGNVIRNRRRAERRREALVARMAAQPSFADTPEPRLQEALAALKPLDREALLLTRCSGGSTKRVPAGASSSPPSRRSPPSPRSLSPVSSAARARTHSPRPARHSAATGRSST